MQADQRHWQRLKSSNSSKEEADSGVLRWTGLHTAMPPGLASISWGRRPSYPMASEAVLHQSHLDQPGVGPMQRLKCALGVVRGEAVHIRP